MTPIIEACNADIAARENHALGSHWVATSPPNNQRSQFHNSIGNHSDDKLPGCLVTGTYHISGSVSTSLTSVANLWLQLTSSTLESGNSYILLLVY